MKVTIDFSPQKLWGSNNQFNYRIIVSNICLVVNLLENIHR